MMQGIFIVLLSYLFVLALVECTKLLYDPWAAVAGGLFRYPMCRDVHWVHVPISLLKSLRQHMWILLGATLVILIFFAVPESWTLC